MKAKPSTWTGDFRAHGLVENPRSGAEFRAIISARRCIEKLKCFDEARRQIAQGASRHDVADYIQQEQKECTTTGLRTMMNYVGLYRKFVIPPAEFIEVIPQPKPERPPEPGAPQPIYKLESPTLDLGEKVQLLRKGIKEVGVLDRMIDIQQQRILNALECEGRLGGWPLASIRPEMQLLKELLSESRSIKSDLGIYQRDGYQRAPKAVNLSMNTTPEFDWGSLKDTEREPAFRLMKLLNAVPITVADPAAPEKKPEPELQPVGA